MAKKIKQKLENTLPVKIICIVCALVLLASTAIVGVMNLFGTHCIYVDLSLSFTKQSFIQGATALAVTVGIFAAVYNLLKIKKAAVYVIVAAAFFRLLSALFWQIEPESDFLVTYDLARLLSNNDLWQWGSVLELERTWYADTWSAHMPFIVYQSLLLRIAENAVILRLANAAFSWGACVLCAKIAQKLGGERAYRGALCVMALNPVIIFFIPVLTNQHISQFLFVLAVWVFFCAKIKNVYIRAWLSGACIGLSHLMRPEMQVVILAVTAYVIYSCFREGNAGTKLTVYAAGMCTLFAVIIAANTFLTSAHVVKRDIYSGNLNYKVMVGLNAATNGTWNKADENLIGNDAAINSQIKSRLAQPHKVIVLMLKKAVYQMGTYVYTWSFDSDSPWINQNIIRYGGTAVMMFVCMLAAWRMIQRRRHELIWLYVTIMGYAMTYSIIEVQGRYSFIFIPMLLIAAFV